MKNLQEQLDYIYLREALEDSAEEVLDSDSIPRTKKDATEFLDDVPLLKPDEIRKQFSKKSSSFDKHYEDAKNKMGEEVAREKVSEGLILLYAAAKSSVDTIPNPSKRTKMYNIIDRVFNTVWNKPGRLFRKGAGIWLSSFILLFMFWWLPPMRTIAKTAGKAGLLMMMIGLVLSIIKYFFKVLAK